MQGLVSAPVSRGLHGFDTRLDDSSEDPISDSLVGVPFIVHSAFVENSNGGPLSRGSKTDFEEKRVVRV